MGLKIVYNQSIHKKLELDTFIHIGFKLMKEMYKDRNIDNIEIPFIKYLSNLEKIADIKYIKSYEELELVCNQIITLTTKYCGGVKDTIIGDAFDFYYLLKGMD